MVNCPKCGRELKHKGALNGHLAWSHGVITEKGKTLDELRNIVKELDKRVTDLETYDPSEKRMTRLCSYCDDFSVRAKTESAEDRLINEHIKQKHPDEPLFVDGIAEKRGEDGIEYIVAKRYEG